MPKEDWGVKRLCPSCATRFYDLNNNPMTCPSCSATFDLESLTAPKTRAPRPEKAKATEAEVVEDDEIVLEDDADDVETDDELLEDDDDDTVNLDDIADVAVNDDD